MLLRNRKYKSGSTWAFWRWTETDSGYITRLHFLKTPWFAIDVHWINKPDEEPYLHDHPVTFLSIILRGWYWEFRNGEFKVRRFWNFVRASANDRHRIIGVAPRGALTLCFMGPKVREWGFHHGKSWLGWKDYYRLKRQGYIWPGD